MHHKLDYSASHPFVTETQPGRKWYLYEPFMDTILCIASIQKCIIYCIIDGGGFHGLFMPIQQLHAQ